MEMSLNLVLLGELGDKPEGSGAEARMVIIRESQDVDSAGNSAPPAFDSPE